jgi:lipid-binding SYLF domain-containing protein
MKLNTGFITVVLAAPLFFAGCTSPEVKKESDRATLASESRAAVDAFNNEDPSLKELMGKAVGYAIFPDIGKAGFIAGGSYGKGEVFEKGTQIGTADITQATFGLQAGAQSFGELILFMRQQDMDAFKSKDWDLAANASVVALKAGAAETADTSKGVIVFVRAKSGMMAEASIGGQRFRFHPITSATTRPSGG